MGKDTVKWVFHTLLLKVYIDAVFLKINLTVIPLPRFCLKEIIRNVDKHLCTKMCITALIIIYKKETNVQH